jgi:transcriptional regulator with XRE-family HTH domain
MNLTEIVCNNLDKVRKEHDLSTRELGFRSGMPQKTVHNVLNMTNVPRIDTVETMCKALLISPQAVVTPYLPLNMLMSRRIGRFVEQYARLNMEQRDKVEQLLNELSDEP